MARRRGKISREWVDDLPPIEIRQIEQAAVEGPDCDRLPDFIGYSERSPTDFVLSGPLGYSRGLGRRFSDMCAATAWLQGTYGERLKEVKCLSLEDRPMWWALIRAAKKPKTPEIP